MVIATQIKRLNAVKTARAASLSALKCLSFSLTARSYDFIAARGRGGGLAIWVKEI